MTSILDSIFEKAKDVAGVATKKTGEIVEISKYKLESVRINNAIEKLYEKLGSAVYSMVKGGYDNQDLIEGLTEEIDELLMRLDAVNDKISDMKDISRCPACGSKNAGDNYYCVKCGSKLKSDFDSEPDYADCEEECSAECSAECPKGIE